MILGSY